MFQQELNYKNMKLTINQVNTIIKNGKEQGLKGQDIFDSLVKRGYEIEGMDSNVAKQAIQAKENPQPVETPKPEGNYFQRVAQDYSNAGKNIVSDINTAATPTESTKGDALQLFNKTLQGVGEVANAAFAPVVEIPLVKKALDFVGEKLGNTELGKSLTKKIQENPETAKDIIAGLNILALGAGKAVEAPLAKVAEKVLPTAIEKPLVTAGKVLQNTGEGLYKVGVPSEVPTKIAVQAYEASKPSLIERVSGLVTGDKKIPLNKPITEAQTAARQGLVGTEVQLGVQAKRASQNLWDNTIKPALETNKTKVNMRTFLDDIKAEIVSNTPDLSRRKELLNSLNKIKTDYKKVGDVSLAKLQDYKVGWAAKVPESSYRGKVISGSLNEVRDMLAKKARQTIYDTVGGDIKTAYFDYGNLKSIADLGIKAQDQLRSKGITKQVWEFVLDTALVPVSTAGGQVIYRTGQGIEFIGKAGAKKVGDIIAPATGAIVTGVVQGVIPKVESLPK